jgi:hypothetical protein
MGKKLMSQLEGKVYIAVSERGARKIFGHKR